MPVVSLRWLNCRFGLIKGVQDGKLTLVFTHKGIAKDGKKKSTIVKTFGLGK